MLGAPALRDDNSATPDPADVSRSTDHEVAATDAVDAATLRRRLAELAAHIHAAQAEMVDLLGRLDDCDGWHDTGIRTIGHWASIELGLDARTVARQVTAARQLRELPAVAAAARAGELGWAKVAQITRVADPGSEQNWLDLAREMSVGQLQRTTKAYTRARREADKASNDGPDEQPGRRRGLWLFDEPDGLVKVAGLLEPDDAAVLKAALNAQLERAWRANQPGRGTKNADARAADRRQTDDPSPAGDTAAAGDPDGVGGPAVAADSHIAGDQTAPGADPAAHGGSAPVGNTAGDDVGTTNPAGPVARDEGAAEPARRDEVDPARRAADPIGARRADALVDLLRDSLGRDDHPDLADDSTQVIVHVDLAFLTGATDVGRCHTNHGDPLPREAARRAACDALLRPLLHDGDQPLDLGRSTRTVNRAQRRALARRDNNCCTFPGCVTTVGLAAHHLTWWENGGRTDLDNLAVLCRFHHKLLHEGGYTAEMVDGRLRFYRPDGRPIGPPGPLPPDLRRGLLALRDRHDQQELGIDRMTPVARSGGDTDWSLSLTLDALFSAEHTRQRAA